MTTDRMVFDNQHDFLHKVQELVQSGVKPQDIDIVAPHPVHGLDEILPQRPSWVRLFALLGGLGGATFGYLFTSGTALVWRLPVGNKWIVGIPAFTIIAFEMTVLFGGVISFLGFLITSRMPAVRTVISEDEFTDSFEIRVKKGG